MKTKWSLHGIAHLLWTFSHVFEVCFASFIFWGHLLVPCKFKLHRLSSRLCRFLALKFEPHHLLFEWCCFTSCFWNLDDVSFLQNDDRLYIRSQCCIISPLWACSCNVKILGGMFRHLQSLHSILWRLQSIGVIFPHIFKVLLAFPCIFKVLIGTSCNFNVLLAFLKSQCLATVLCTLDVWAMLPLKIGVVVALL